MIFSRKSYMNGEYNAVKACGTAIGEAVDAIKNNSIGLTDSQKAWILIEFQGIIIRSSMIITEKNKELQI